MFFQIKIYPAVTSLINYVSTVEICTCSICGSEVSGVALGHWKEVCHFMNINTGIAIKTFTQQVQKVNTNQNWQFIYE